MASKEEEIQALLAPVVAGLGLELLGLEWSGGHTRSLLRLYIDAAGRPVTVDDCEAVSREVEGVLDVHDPIQGRYTLEVSSPGIDRPLFTLEQFARHAGEAAKVVLRLPVNGRRRLQGVIAEIAGEAVVLTVEGAPWRISFDNIEKANIVPDLVALGLVKPEPHRAGGKRRKP